jgi:hypothetical protein
MSLTGQQQQQPKHNKRPGVYSSPAVLSLDRVMQSFRARTQLLAEALEENDEVMQVKIESNSDLQAAAEEFIETVESDDNDERFLYLIKF